LLGIKVNREKLRWKLNLCRWKIDWYLCV